MREHLERCPACAAEHARVAGLPRLLALAEGLEETPAPPAGDRGPGARRRRARAVAHRDGPPAPAPLLAAPARPRARRGGRRRAGRARARLRPRAAGSPRRRRGYALELTPVGGSGARASARLSSVSGGTTLHLSADDLAGDPSIVYEVYCEGGGSTASAGTFRADARGHAYAVLTTALRRGEYDEIRVVRKQRDARGRVQTSAVLEAQLPSS